MHVLYNHIRKHFVNVKISLELYSTTLKTQHFHEAYCSPFIEQYQFNWVFRAIQFSLFARSLCACARLSQMQQVFKFQGGVCPPCELM